MKSLLVLLSLCVAVSAAAQQTPAVSAESVQVNLVEIPVNVFNRSGEAIRGLKPEDFEVYDDGKRRRITHFEEIDLAKMSSPGTLEVQHPAARRNFLLTFDLTSSRPKALLRAREAAEKFLEGVNDRDLVAVATFSVEQGFRFVSSFTTDRDLNRSSIASLGSSRFYEAIDPLQILNTTESGTMDQPQLSETDFLRQGVEENQQIILERTAQINDQYLRQRIDRQLDTFAYVARFLDSIRGRKQVVLLSEGFNTRLIEGQNATDEGNAAVTHGEVWRIDNDQRFGSSSTARQLDDMGRLFRRSDVVLHAIDIRGVPTATDITSGSPGKASDSLYLLSSVTGGNLFRHSNDLGNRFARMLKQQEVVYILGFQTTQSGNPGKFHDLKVKVNVVGQRGLRVNHRSGYYEPKAQLAAVEQGLAATDILMNDIPYEEVEVNLLAAPFPQKESGSAEVPVIAEISGPDLLSGVKGDVLNAEFFIYAFDEENKVRDFLFQTISFDLSKMRPALASKGVKYYGTLELRPGRYAIKSLVRVVESGSNGFRRLDIKVPGKEEALILPALVFEEPGQWIMLKAAKTAAGQTDYPFVLLEESFIPSARPSMAKDETYKLVLFMFNSPPADFDLVARVEGKDGSHRNPNLKLVGRTAEENGPVKLLFEFSPATLAAGDYVLHLTVRPRESDESSESSLRFRVRDEAATEG